MALEGQPECHIALTFEGPAWTSPYATPVMLLQNMLGAFDRLAPGENAAPLAQEITARGLLHSYNTLNIGYKETGLFGLYMTADPGAVARDSGEPVLPAAVEAVTRHMARFAYDIHPEELERAKTALKSLQLSTLDSFEKLAEELGRQLLAYDRRVSPAEMCARIDAVTVEDMKLTAKALVCGVDHAMAAVGTVDGLPTYEWIRSRTDLELHDPATGWDWTRPWGGKAPPPVDLQRLDA